MILARRRPAVMDHQGDTIPASLIRYYTDMFQSAPKYHDIPRLPIGQIVHIIGIDVGGQLLGMTGQEYLEITDPAEVDVGVRVISGFTIGRGRLSDIIIHHLFKIVSSRGPSPPYNISAGPPSFRRVTLII